MGSSLVSSLDIFPEKSTWVLHFNKGMVLHVYSSLGILLRNWGGVGTTSQSFGTAEQVRLTRAKMTLIETFRNVPKCPFMYSIA